MKVNGRIPEMKDSNVETEEAKPMYKHDHEEVPTQLLTSTNADNQFQVIFKIFFLGHFYGHKSLTFLNKLSFSLRQHNAL